MNILYNTDNYEYRKIYSFALTFNVLCVASADEVFGNQLVRVYRLERERKKEEIIGYMRDNA